jgi:hypothetical protein
VTDEEFLAFERAAVQAVAGAVAAGLQELVVAILAAFEAVGKAAGEAVAERVAAVTWMPMRPALMRVSAEAQTRGVQDVVRAMSRGKRRDQATRAEYRVQTRTLPDPDATLRKALAEAARLARQGDGKPAAGRIKAGVSAVKGQASVAANDGINSGVIQVARVLGERVMWVPERDACLHCLAHAGYVVEPGQDFPPVSFDPKAKGVWSVDCPPLHPWCRCRARPVDLPAGKPSSDRSDVSPASVLAREARRSVAYQWSGHASRTAGERAAEALLNAGANLPGTVTMRAQRALRKGGIRRPS